MNKYEKWMKNLIPFVKQQLKHERLVNQLLKKLSSGIYVVWILPKFRDIKNEQWFLR